MSANCQKRLLVKESGNARPSKPRRQGKTDFDYEIETKRGAELFRDPMSEAAMYILYRQAYDPVAFKDREKEIAGIIAKHGVSREEAESLARSPVSSWSHSDWKRDWKRPLGDRAPAWIFTGVFPRSEDILAIQQMTGVSVERRSQEMRGYIQDLADAAIAAGKPEMKYAGGVSWQIVKPGLIRLTGMWGRSGIAKIRAAAEVTSKANAKNFRVFMGTDSVGRKLIYKAEKNMPTFHSKGLVPASYLGLLGPPKCLIPIIFEAIAHSAIGRSGRWQSFNPETGGLKIQITGSGQREKFILGNQQMWQSVIQQILKMAAITPEEAHVQGLALKAGGPMGKLVAAQINQKMREAFSNFADNIPRSALLWLWLIKMV